MNPSTMSIKQSIENLDFKWLRNTLKNEPKLANEGITIPFDIVCQIKAHPLHRLCDTVFARKMTEKQAIQFAQIFLESGADIDGYKQSGAGTPLLAAASLHAEQLGIFYINNGADVQHTHHNDGASALHWAAFCGRDQLVNRLIEANASIDIPDNKYKSTPLGWAIQCLLSNDLINKHNQVYCIKTLLHKGASISKLNKEKENYLFSLANADPELQNLVK